MSSYQILRIALQTISTGDWTTHGITMALAQEDEDQVHSKPQLMISSVAYLAV